jgi:hypothetical protein
MQRLKAESFTLTSEYLKLLFVEVRLAEAGVDAPLRDINIANQIRMNIGLADESLRYQLRRQIIRDDDY